MTTFDVRVGPLQLAALQCHSDAFEPDGTMPAVYTAGRLAFSDADALATYITEVANSADAQHERDHEPADLRMCHALGRLSVAIGRTHR